MVAATLMRALLGGQTFELKMLGEVGKIGRKMAGLAGLTGEKFKEFINAVEGSLHPGGLKQTAAAIEKWGLPASAVIADIGCGTGATLSLLKKFGYSNISGYDIDDQMLEMAGRVSGATVTKASAHCLPVEDEFYDGLLCECVLSLTVNSAITLREFYRILKPGGKLVLSDITCMATEDAPGSFQKFSYQSLRDQLDMAGFKLQFSEDRSTGLKEMAAQLLWHGLNMCELMPAETEKPLGKHQYWLFIAQK